MQLLPAPNHVWIPYSGKSRMNWKQCEKNCFCQTVVPSCISESENFRKHKTILLHLLFSGKRKIKEE